MIWFSTHCFISWSKFMWNWGFFDTGTSLRFFRFSWLVKILNEESLSKVWTIKNNTNLNSIFCLIKSSKLGFIFLPAFYLFMWLMKSSNSFEKIAIQEIWQLVFFWVIKTYFGILPLKWCIFRHGKNWFSQILPCNSYCSH